MTDMAQVDLAVEQLREGLFFRSADAVQSLSAELAAVRVRVDRLSETVERACRDRDRAEQAADVMLKIAKASRDEAERLRGVLQQVQAVHYNTSDGFCDACCTQWPCITRHLLSVSGSANPKQEAGDEDRTDADETTG